MFETIELSATPAEEDCEQAGPNYDVAKAKRECRVFIGLIRRWLIANGHEDKLTRLEESGDFRLFIKANPHDFGTYHEVAVKVNEDSEEAVELAYMIDSDAPGYWDEEAKKELADGR